MYVYEIVNKVNGKRYIGQTSQQDVTGRWKQHIYLLNGQRHENRFLQNAWNKYGPLNFSFHVIELCDKEEDLTIAENKWMEYYQSKYNQNGYNLIAGTSSNHFVGRKIRSLANRPEGYPRVVDPMGVEFEVVNLREFCRQHNLTQPGFRALVVKRSVYHYRGWRLSMPDTVGVQYNDVELKHRGQRISHVKMKGRILNVLSPDGNIYSVENISRFAKQHGLSKGNLSNVLSGKLEQTKGWRLAP